ncbi:olfactory receptor 142-like [Oryzias melastigma]|uniref:olfactory receptor 142-like n=1 Tax=Oryzias melastigma TaxID=30732 RepID=UPI000CF7C201|nr:olfactory receptor 142-like [Oryzias melastigma]
MSLTPTTPTKEDYGSNDPSQNRILTTDMNVTYISLEGHVEIEKYRYFYFFMMLTVYILIVCSNCTIVSLIVIQKNLHEPMYIFIAALLINSVLFSTNIYPKLLADFLSKEQIISYEACLLQIFVFYSLSGSEFLLLAAMSYDRYVSICKPLQYAILMKKMNVILLLGSAWIVPFCHLVVPIVGDANLELCSFSLKGIFCNNSINYLFCAGSKALLTFGLVTLFNIAILPMLFIIFTYAKILIVAYKSCKEVRRKAAQTCLPHLLVLINYSCLVTYDMIIIRLESNFSKSARFIMTLQMIMYNPLCNPIIYGLKMTEIYKHLKKLFYKIRHNW